MTYRNGPAENAINQAVMDIIPGQRVQDQRSSHNIKISDAVDLAQQTPELNLGSEEDLSMLHQKISNENQSMQDKGGHLNRTTSFFSVGPGV